MHLPGVPAQTTATNQDDAQTVTESAEVPPGGLNPTGADNPSNSAAGVGDAAEPRRLLSGPGGYAAGARYSRSRCREGPGFSG